MALKRTEKKKKRKHTFVAPSHTRGYYRFSKDFPSVTDSEGYRDNDLIVNSPSKKASVRRRLIALFICIFIVSFCVTTLMFTVSKVPVALPDEPLTGEDEEKTFYGNSAIYINGSVLSMSSAERVIGNVRYHGMDTVVIDFKDAQGNFYYNPSINVAADALTNVGDNAEKIVKEFQSASIRVYARFCMFADDIYARTNQKEAAYVMTAAEDGTSGQVRTVWYNDGDDSHAWLNPYSQEVQYYLRCCVEDINNIGVDGIIFDYVSLPLSYQTAAVQFDGSDDSAPDEAITSFINLLNNTYIDCETAVCVPVDAMLDALKTGTAPLIFGSGCDYVIPDARLSLMPENTVVGTHQYAKPSVSPVEFITEYVTSIKKLAGADTNSVRIMPLIEASDTSAKEISALAGVNNDSFIIYSADNNYTNQNFN